MTGKEKCELLRTIRKNIAEKNGIPYEPGVCYHEGDCPGFCPRCDEESAFLMYELKKKETLGYGIVIDTEVFGKINDLNKPINSLMNSGNLESLSSVKTPMTKLEFNPVTGVFDEIPKLNEDIGCTIDGGCRIPIDYRRNSEQDEWT